MISLGRALAWVFSASAGIAGCNLAFSLDGYAGTSRGNCSHCAGTHCECAPKPPDNFDYARLQRAPKAGTLCPPGMALGQAIGSGQRDTGCACTCNSPTPGGPCGFTAYTADACSGTISTAIEASSGCASIPAGSISARTLAASGSCEVVALPNPPEFNVPFLACLDTKPASDDACGSGSLCATSAGSPFDPAACIAAKSAIVSSCPSDYPHGYTFATGFNDGRSCDKSNCACKPQTCTGSEVSLCQDSGCTTCPTKAPDSCFKFGGLSYARVDVPGKTVGSCEPTGTSVGSGTLTTAGTLLVCCAEALSSGP